MASLVSSPGRFDLLVLGHVTRDEFGSDARLGGAASFAAQAGVLLGLRTALLTAAHPDFPWLAPLSNTPGLAVRVVPAAFTTTFALDYAGPRRTLFLRAAAPRLSAGDVPAAFSSAPIVYAGPVAGEVDGDLVADLGAHTFVCVGLQGWLRKPTADGKIEPALAPEIASPPANVRAAVLSEEDHPDAEAIAGEFSSRGMVVALTRGARGATVLTTDGRTDIPAAPATEVDPTGAGDVFGVTFAVALARGRAPEEAARLAADAAARVVEGPGLGRLASFEAGRLRGAP